MADAGLDAELLLDTARALRAVDEVEARLDRATNIVIGADARQVTSAIEAALASVDTSIAITGDAADVTGSITAAVDAADTGVVVTADAGDVTGSITAATDAADTHVEVTADTTQAQASVAALGRESQVAAGGVFSLHTALAALAGLGVASVLGEIVTAASDIGESSSKASVVFGDSFGVIEDYAEAAATAVGLSQQAAFEATGTFGNLFQALGVTRNEASRLAPEVVTLAADLASFNNLDVTDALEKLRSGLVGEIEPLRSLGVSFNAADVEARALADGLAVTADEITEGDKVLARYALVVEQTRLAQGDFIRTSDGLANQQRILRAEFQNLAASAGQQLLPVVLDLVQMARDDLIPQLGELADAVLPALGQGLLAAAPLFGSMLDIVVALAPVLQVVADVISSIPEPLLIMAGTGLLAQRALSGVGDGVLNLVSGLRGLGPVLRGTATGTAGLPGMVSGLASMNPLLIFGGIALGGIAAAASNAAKRKREFQREVKEATEALRDEDDVLQVTTAAIGRYIEEQSRFADRNQTDDLERLGLQFGNVAALAKQGADGLASFTQRALERGEIDAWNNSLSETVDVASLTSAQLRELTETGSTYVQGAVVSLRGNTDLRDSFVELQRVTKEAAEQELTRLAVTDEASAAIVAQAQAENRLADGTLDVYGALQQANSQLRFHQQELARTAEETARTLEHGDAVAQSFLGVSDALGVLGDSAPGVRAQLQDLRFGAGDSERNFLDLAIAVDTAKLSEEEMGAVATVLGTDVDTLTGFVDELTGAVDEFASAATSKLPTVSAVFGDVLEAARGGAADAADAIRQGAQDRIEALRAEAQAAGTTVSDDLIDAITEGADREARRVEESGRVTAAAFAAGLRLQADDLADFRNDLAHISDAGFADLARVIAEQGPEVGGALADELQAALAAGNLTIVEELSAATSAFEAEWTSTEEFFRTTLGPQFILTSGLVGQGAAAAFGDNLDFEDRVRIAAGLAATGLDEAGQAVAAVAAAEGSNAARAYGEALGLDDESIAAAIAAGAALRDAPRDLLDGASAGGAATGSAYGDGVIWGLNSKDPFIRAAARGVAAATDAEIRMLWGVRSPARVGIELGGFFGEGIAIGLEEKRDRVAVAARFLGEAATAAAAASVGAEAAVALTGVATAHSFATVRPEVTASTLAAQGALSPGVGGVDQASLTAAMRSALASSQPLVGQIVMPTVEDPRLGAYELIRQLRALQDRQGKA